MTAATTSSQSIRVWDAPVRVFHWLMVLSFAGAYITSESERWRLVHISLGYTLGGLVAFRLVWGLVGTRYARFASFVRGPQAVVQYVRSLGSAEPEHHVGHNPAGALAIVLMLVSSVVIVATGWALYNDVGPEGLDGIHEAAANTLLFLVGVHVAGVVVASWLHHENLVRAMVTGRKMGTPSQGIARVWGSLAAVVLACVLGFWGWQWQHAPSADAAQTSSTASGKQSSEDD
ncbi:cytochrome b/b6 domain-containing protein [Rhodoferax aquaticus]|uniref:Cytochrome B n=1 Tax=Rhodoferax aquaticus TaxID=2527691 RepID=A0A515EUW5_9BURK|nr:cytochrome b/b6 domain-containing protein [Rhodoferax aquaticus]QDL56399.1 cytochrome B [Rhodoferax aquaticus]